MPSNALPMFFRAAILEARNPKVGYLAAGSTLAIHFEDLADEEDLEHLDAAIQSGDCDTALWNRIAAALPRCASIVPTRRRAAVIAGVLQAIDDGRV